MRVPTEGDQPSIMFIHLSCEYYTRLAVCVKNNLDFLIAPPRFELGQGEPKSPVLPLHQGAKGLTGFEPATYCLEGNHSTN